MFVGEERLEIVDGLVDAFAAVADGAGPRAVVLSAPTGWGKTAIVQEFYARIAAQQPTPAYWPVRLEGEASLGWTQTRKRVAPLAFEVPAGAELPWMWWGISCARRQDGRYAQAMFDDASQLALHGGSLFARMSQGGIGGRTFDGTSALVGVLGILGVALVPPAAVGLAVAGAGRTLWQSRDLLDRLSQSKSRRETKQMGFSIDVESHSKVDQLQQLANDLEAISRKVPIVLIVDDAQWADSTLLETLSWVMRRSTARVLVVATTWPLDDEREETNPFHMWTQELRRSVSLSGAVELIELGMFSDAALRQLVLDEFLAASPSAEADLHADVVDGVLDLVGGTPMGVRALFGLARTKALIADGDFTLEAIGALPADLDEALRSYWKEIPPDVQTVLAIAAVTGHKFLPAPVIEAAAAQGIEDAAVRLRRGENPYAYVRFIETELATFIDPVFFGTAERAADELLTPKQLQSIQDAVVEFAIAASLDEYPASICELAWSVHISMAELALTETSPAAASARQVAQLAASKRDFPRAISAARQSLSWEMDPDSLPALNLRGLVVSWLGECGLTPEALDESHRLYVDRLRVLGPDHPDCLEARSDIAWWLGECGRREDSLVAFEDLLPDVIRVLGSDHPEALWCRNNLAIQVARSGRDAEAIQMYDLLLVDHNRVLGHDSDLTLTTRLNRAVSLARSGRELEAIDEFRELIADRTEAFGADDRSLLTIRGQLANSLGNCGKLSEAVETYSALVKDCTALLGRDHPATLESRKSAAVWTAESGARREAFIELDSLLLDFERLLGRDHLLTIDCRKQVAFTLCQLRDFEKAFDHYTDLISSQSRILGPDSPDVLRTRIDFAEWMLEAGRFQDMPQTLSALLDDSMRLLGAESPIVLSARRLMFQWRVRSQDFAGLDQDFKNLLADHVRVLGIHHPDTFDIRDQFAYALGVSGRVDEAIAELRSVVRDQREFGVEFPTIIQASRNLDFLLQRVWPEGTQ